MSILIVDDTQDNLLVMKVMLRAEGLIDVITAANAKQAYEHLGILDGPPKNSSEVNLILMDLMMPEISGIDACRKIKSFEALRDIPIITITARTDTAALEESFQAGAMDFVTKPVRRYEVMARVRSALQLKSTIDLLKDREHTLRMRNEELEKAFQEIKVLRGFIPVCATCKKIRNMEGSWQQMESYFQQHSDVKFSHGICEICMKKHYPDYKDTKADKS